MSSNERKVRQKEALRAGILEAARNIALRDGWQAVTIRKIADEVEYTPPIVYEHFVNKEAVLFEIAKDGFRLLRGGLESEEKNGSDSKHRLINYAKIHWEFANQYPQLYKLMFGIETMPSLAAERPQEVLAIGEMIKSAIKAIAPTLEEQELKELYFQWMCVVNGFITMALIMQDRAPQNEKWEPEQYLERANRRFIKSIS